MTYFQERWRETLAGLDIIGKGGATGEGNGYGASPTGINYVLAANVAYTAADEDLFVRCVPEHVRGAGIAAPGG
jgi:hypothetical protein